jgi:hypothetical protein
MLVSSVCRERQRVSSLAGGHFRSGFGAFRPLLPALSAPGSRDLTLNGPSATSGIGPRAESECVERTKLVAGSLALTNQPVYRTEFLSRRRVRQPFNRVIEFNDPLTCRR